MQSARKKKDKIPLPEISLTWPSSMVNEREDTLFRYFQKITLIVINIKIQNQTQDECRRCYALNKEFLLPISHFYYSGLIPSNSIHASTPQFWIFVVPNFFCSCETTMLGIVEIRGIQFRSFRCNLVMAKNIFLAYWPGITRNGATPQNDYFFQMAWIMGY